MSSECKIAAEQKHERKTQHPTADLFELTSPSHEKKTASDEETQCVVCCVTRTLTATLGRFDSSTARNEYTLHVTNITCVSLHSLVNKTQSRYDLHEQIQ